MKLCNITSRVSGELTKIQLISPLKFVISQFVILQKFNAFFHSVLQNLEWNRFKFKTTTLDFSEKCGRGRRSGAEEEEVADMQEIQKLRIRARFASEQGQKLVISGERWWLILSSPLTLAVNLHNFTFHCKNMCKICGEKKTTFHRLSYLFFRFLLNPGCELQTTQK